MHLANIKRVISHEKHHFCSIDMMQPGRLNISVFSTLSDGVLEQNLCSALKSSFSRIHKVGNVCNINIKTFVSDSESFPAATIVILSGNTQGYWFPQMILDHPVFFRALTVFTKLFWCVTRDSIGLFEQNLSVLILN